MENEFQDRKSEHQKCEPKSDKKLKEEENRMEG